LDTLEEFTVLLIQNSDPGTSIMVPSLYYWILLKWISTAALLTPVDVLELWMSWLSLFNLIQLALNPNMKSILSIRFDLPEPFGPTTLVKLPWNFPIICRPAYDLKSSRTMWSITKRGCFYLITLRLIPFGLSTTTFLSYFLIGFDSSGANLFNISID